MYHYFSPARVAAGLTSGIQSAVKAVREIERQVDEAMGVVSDEMADSQEVDAPKEEEGVKFDSPVQAENSLVRNMTFSSSKKQNEDAKSSSRTSFMSPLALANEWIATKPEGKATPAKNSPSQEQSSGSAMKKGKDSNEPNVPSEKIIFPALDENAKTDAADLAEDLNAVKHIQSALSTPDIPAAANDAIEGAASYSAPSVKVTATETQVQEATVDEHLEGSIGKSIEDFVPATLKKANEFLTKEGAIDSTTDSNGASIETSSASLVEIVAPELETGTNLIPPSDAAADTGKLSVWNDDLLDLTGELEPERAESTVMIDGQPVINKASVPSVVVSDSTVTALPGSVSLSDVEEMKNAEESAEDFASDWKDDVLDLTTLTSSDNMGMAEPIEGHIAPTTVEAPLSSSLPQAGGDVAKDIAEEVDVAIGELREEIWGDWDAEDTIATPTQDAATEQEGEMPMERENVDSSVPDQEHVDDASVMGQVHSLPAEVIKIAPEELQNQIEDIGDESTLSTVAEQAAESSMESETDINDELPVNSENTSLEAMATPMEKELVDQKVEMVPQEAFQSLVRKLEVSETRWIETHEQLDEAESQISLLTAQLEEANRKMRDYEARLSSNMTTVDTNAAEVVENRATIRALKKDLSRAQDESSHLSRRVKTLEQELAESQAKAQEILEEGMGLSKRQGVLEATVRSLRETNRGLENQKQDLEEKLEQAVKAQEDLMAQLANYSSLVKNAEKGQKTFESSVLAKDSRIANLESELQLLREELNATKQSLDVATSELLTATQKQKDSEADFQESEKTRKELELQLQNYDTNSSANTQKIAALEAKINEMTKALADTRRNAEHRENQLRQQFESATEKLQQQIASSDASLFVPGDSLRSHLISGNGVASGESPGYASTPEMRTMQDSSDSVIMLRNRMMELEIRLQTEQEQWMAQRLALTKQISDLETSYRSEKLEKSKLLRNIAMHNSEIQARHDEIVSLQESAQTLKLELSEKHDVLLSTQEKLTRVTSELEDRLQSLQKFEDIVRDLQFKVEEISHRDEMNIRVISQLQDECRALQDRVFALTEAAKEVPQPLPEVSPSLSTTREPGIAPNPYLPESRPSLFAPTQPQAFQPWSFAGTSLDYNPNGNSFDVISDIIHSFENEKEFLSKNVVELTLKVEELSKALHAMEAQLREKISMLQDSERDKEVLLQMVGEHEEEREKLADEIVALKQELGRV